MVNAVHRTLKHHEQRLLRKHDFLSYKSERTSNEGLVIRKYCLQDREDYTRYNKLCGLVRSLVNQLRYLATSSPIRIQITEQLLEKLHNMGVTGSAQSLEVIENLTTSSFCKRRLPVIMVAMRFAQKVAMATQVVQQGHVRVGTTQVTDPAYLVPRAMEDHIHWMAKSKVRGHVLEYAKERDDYDLGN